MRELLKVNYAREAQPFRAHVERFLAEREAENNLVFGVLAAIIGAEYSFSHDPPLLASVEGERGIELVALRTPPFNLILSTAAVGDAPATLARELHAAGQRLPGVTAPLGEAEAFARAWCEITGERTRVEHSQRIYRLEHVTPPRSVPGELHLCSEQDIALAGEWMAAFNRDVGEHDVPADPRRYIGRKSAGLFFWIDGRAVSMAGFSGPTPRGIRVAAVYTPPELRGRGYASACVAALSGWLLAHGREFCFLYTDLANPTSNHIYQEIGYRPVCDAIVLRFEPR